jgi:hypothetical protein
MSSYITVFKQRKDSKKIVERLILLKNESESIEELWTDGFLVCGRLADSAVRLETSEELIIALPLEVLESSKKYTVYYWIRDGNIIRYMKAKVDNKKVVEEEEFARIVVEEEPWRDFFESIDYLGIRGDCFT